MIAIIPARGGSKGLNRKNIRSLGGVPLICHTIKTALAAKSISRVLVSTEDKEIASIALECGAEVPCLRPSKLAADNSIVIDTYLHMLEKISKDSSHTIESFVALLPTVPLRLPIDIDNAVKIFEDKKADTVISVTQAPVPVQWYKKITSEGLLQNYFPEFNLTKNRQEEEITYIPNGSIYIFQTEILRMTRQYYNDNTYPYIMPLERSADIDELIDFEWAEFLLNKKTNRHD